MAFHQITVTNIGVVYMGESKSEATQTYLDYVKLSADNYGKAAGETIYWMVDGYLHKEYMGTLEHNVSQ